VPDDERSAKGALEPLVQILDEPGREQRHRQPDVAPNLARERDAAAPRASRFDLVSQREDDCGPVVSQLSADLASGSKVGR
jgi:hypothetical protein